MDDKVIVELVENYISQGGIMTQGMDQLPIWEGIVIAKGPGGMCANGARNTIMCEVGDYVLFSPLGAVPYREGTRKLMMMDRENLFNTLTPPEAE